MTRLRSEHPPGRGKGTTAGARDVGPLGRAKEKSDPVALTRGNRPIGATSAGAQERRRGRCCPLAACSETGRSGSGRCLSIRRLPGLALTSALLALPLRRPRPRRRRGAPLGPSPPCCWSCCVCRCFARKHTPKPRRWLAILEKQDLLIFFLLIRRCHLNWREVYNGGQFYRLYNFVGWYIRQERRPCGHNPGRRHRPYRHGDYHSHGSGHHHTSSPGPLATCSGVRGSGQGSLLSGTGIWGVGGSSPHRHRPVGGAELS